MRSRKSVWLQREPSEEAAARVFCVPHAGCGTGVFRDWPERQGAVEFIPVELPGRLSRFGERMPATFQELADDMIAGLTPHMDVPFAFFGHCWSALLAYEATARLQRAGGPEAAHLFVSSQLAPQDGPVGRMLGMDEAELAGELETMIRDQGGTPHPELVTVYLKVLRDDVEMSRRYVVPAPLRLTCPVTAIGWRDDDEVTPGQMTGWPACGDTTFELFDGRHNRFIEAPAELLRTLCAGMAGRGPSRLPVTSR